MVLVQERERADKLLHAMYVTMVSTLYFFRGMERMTAFPTHHSTSIQAGGKKLRCWRATTLTVTWRTGFARLPSEVDYFFIEVILSYERLFKFKFLFCLFIFILTF